MNIGVTLEEENQKEEHYCVNIKKKLNQRTTTLTKPVRDNLAFLS